MTSNRYSKLTILALLLAVTLALAVPATAVTVDQTNVPGEAEAGSQISASFTLTDLYQDPQWEPWTLKGETELTNVTWTLTFIDPQGNEFHTETYNGQQFTQPGITTDHDLDTITEIRVEITGEVPAPGQYTYPEKETFVLADLTQISSQGGAQGAQNELDTWETHHYTAADESNPDAAPGSKDAREALDSAKEAINATEEAGGDASTAEDTLDNAISAYENGNFENAVSLAEDAQSEAETAQQSKEQGQMLLFGGVGVLVVLLGVGGFWYYRQQQDSYDKLG